MKKLISFLCLLMLTAVSAWAKVATYNFSAEPEVSWPDGYFTHEGDWKFTSIEPALEYSDLSFSVPVGGTTYQVTALINTSALMDNMSNSLSISMIVKELLCNGRSVSMGDTPISYLIDSALRQEQQ